MYGSRVSDAQNPWLVNRWFLGCFLWVIVSYSIDNIFFLKNRVRFARIFDRMRFAKLLAGSSSLHQITNSFITIWVRIVKLHSPQIHYIKLEMHSPQSIALSYIEVSIYTIYGITFWVRISSTGLFLRNITQSSLTWGGFHSHGGTPQKLNGL